MSELTNPTDEQIDIITATAKRHGSLMVEAGAGCAKTSTMSAAAKGIRVPGMGLSFNRRTADELRGKLPSWFETKTMNGLGHQALSRSTACGSGKLVLDDRKIGKLVSEISREWKQKLGELDWNNTKHLVTWGMLSGIAPDSDLALASDTPESWLAAADSAGLLPSEAEPLVPLAQEVLRRSNALARQGIICFDDQIYFSLFYGGRFQTSPMVMVDEDQDLNRLQIEMLRRVVSERLFAVGDKHQGIYRFRGAMGEAAEQLRQLRPESEWQDFPLMTSFRCPQAVVARQQHHVEGFRAAPQAPIGKVLWLAPPPGGPENWVWSWKDIQDQAWGTTIAVVCRNNAPLVKLAFKLIRQGIGVCMLGRELGKGLSALSKKLIPHGETGITQVIDAVQQWEAAELDKLAKAGKLHQLINVSDRAECLYAITETSGAQTAGELRSAVAKLFDCVGPVVLTTGHKAKGLEWDTVVHLDPWRVPSSHAKRELAKGHPEAMVQELNLRYVIETRTKHTLLMTSMTQFV